MKKLSLIFSIMLLLTICNAYADDKVEDYFKRNIAITDVKARNVGIDKFVIEMSLIDFNKSSSLPEGFGFNHNITYADNGKEYDLIKGDGIYTSIQTFSFEELIKMGGTKISGDPKFYIDEKFQYIAEIEQKPTFGIRIKCEFELCCPCVGGSCPACDWFGWKCWNAKKCEVEINLGI